MLHSLRIRPKPMDRAGYPKSSLYNVHSPVQVLPRVSGGQQQNQSKPRVTWPSVSEIAWGLASDKIAIILAVALTTLTVLSAGPLHPIDEWINTAPRPFFEEIRVFVILWLDIIATRLVALPVLAVTALQLAYWYRSWRPIILSGVAVFGMMSLVAAMKLLFTRGHPRTYDPSFFSDGGGVSFPSGHGANSILIYGLVLFLIIRYSAARPHIVRLLTWCIVGIAIWQGLVSTYLHFHWFSDLVTGMVAGGFALRLTIRLDRIIPEGRTAYWWPWYGRKLWSGEERRSGENPQNTVVQ